MRAASAVDNAHVLKTFGYFTAPQLGAALEFIHGMVALGSPPSLDSVTRDTYPPTAAFGGRFISSVACGIGEALVHVHARRISHGDVYAHNILVRPEASARMRRDARRDARTRLPASAARRRRRARRSWPTSARRSTTATAKRRPHLSGWRRATAHNPPIAMPRRSYANAACHRAQVRAFGLLLRELLDRHNGAEPELLGPVRVAAESAITDATTRPLFAPLVAQLGCARA